MTQFPALRRIPSHLSERPRSLLAHPSSYSTQLRLPGCVIIPAHQGYSLGAYPSAYPLARGHGKYQYEPWDLCIPADQSPVCS
eukprot:754699-Hanusia_phi.AAC.1